MEQIRLDLIPNGVMPNIHASQFDHGRTIRFNLCEGKTPFSLLATDYVKVACNNVESVSLANVGNSHDWTIPDSVVADSGVFIGELTIERDSVIVGSKNFVLNVEADAYNGKNIEERTASGTIANFETNLQDNLTACKCEINPVQDLHGYSKPWSGGAGKNKVDFPSYASASSQNLTIQTTGNGGFKVTGTPSTSWAILTSNIDVNIPSGQAITFGITGGTLSHNVYLNLTYADSTTDTLLINSGNTSKTMTLAKNLIKVRLDYSGMNTSTNYNETFYPMLEYGSTQSAFEPYENICPISGFNGATIVRCGANLVDDTNFTYGLPNPAISSNIDNIIASTRYAYWGFIPPKTNCIFSVKSNNINKYNALLLFGYKEGKLVYYTQISVYTDQIRTQTFDFSSYDYFRICIGGGSGETTYEDLTGNGFVMLNVGSTATAYKPFVGSQYAPYFEGLLNGSYGFVDLGSLSWTYYQDGIFYTTLTGRKQGGQNLVCSEYKTSSVQGWTYIEDKAVVGNIANANVYVRDSDYSDATTFTNAMNGVYLIYELATPTTPTITQSQIDTLIRAFSDDLVCVVFGQTVYGGVLDVTNGKLKITHKSVDLGDLAWTKQTSVGGTKTYFRTASEIADCKKNTNVGQLQGLICSNYAEDTWSHTVDTVGYDSTICTGWTNRSYIAINDQSKVSMSADDFKTAMSGVMLCYELATPTEITLTPKQIEAIVGINNVFHDCNGQTEVKYLVEV